MTRFETRCKPETMCKPETELNTDIVWRDLVALKPWEIVKELLLPLPGVIAAYFCAINGYVYMAALCVAYVFMMSLRVGHNAYHRSLGLPKWANDVVLFVVSVFCLGSAHAIRHTHLVHHSKCMKEEDVEGHLAHLNFWQAVAHSPRYPILIHVAAWKNGNKITRRWMVTELMASFCLQMLLMAYVGIDGAGVYLAWMMVANITAPLLGIWLVHHTCDGHATVARTCRSMWLNRLSAGMFYHLEHHVFPAVPTCHMTTLATRFDHANQDKIIPLIDECLRPCRAGILPFLFGNNVH